MPQPAATHLVGISFKFSKDFEGLSTRLASKQRENAETELRRVLVLTSHTASPMPLKRGREPIWPHFCSIFRISTSDRKSRIQANQKIFAAIYST